MIEMRWHHKMVEHSDGYMMGPLKVLQYRYRYPLPYQDIRDYPAEDWQWSEWKDVADA